MFQRSARSLPSMLLILTLFLVFSIMALFVVGTGGGIYEQISATMEENYELRTSLLYLTNKVRQGDAGGVSIEMVEGVPALVTREQAAGSEYVTYIYHYDGAICELYIQEGVDFTLENGAKIMEIADVKMESVSDRMFRFTCESAEGKELSTVVTVRC